MTRTRQLASLARLFLLALLTVVLVPHVLHGRAATPAPPLPPPTGTIVNVSTEAQLQTAVLQLASNTTLILAPGTYVLTSTLYLNGTFTNVTIRGGTNNRDDVVLQGPGMTNANFGNTGYGIWTGGNVQGLTIANLTIRDVFYHPINFNAGTQSPHVYNVHLIDAGEQFIKSNPDGAGGGVNNGIVEYSVIEYTSMAKDYYTNGVDIHTGANWIIRHNLFRNITAPAGQLAGPAVLAWNGSSNTLTEGNTFLNCARAIAYGLLDLAGGTDHSGGIIRNNFIYRSSTQAGDVAIGIADSPNTQVLNNTVYLSGTYATPIEYRFASSTGVRLTNNLVDGFIFARDGATGTELNNLTGVSAGLFVNAAAGDLHLASTAASAIDHGVALTNVTDDFDGQSRPAGPAQDIGADEYMSSDITAPTVTMTAPAAGATVSGSVTVSATASDNVGVVGVQFKLDGVNLGAEDTATPFSTTWNTTTSSNGSHTLTAVARDAAGNTATATSVTVTVNNVSADTIAPTVALTAPAGGATVTGSAVALSATASDNVGVAGVQFKLDGANLGGEDIVSPYTQTWNTTTTANGSHSLTAVARDAAGNSTTSAAVTVTVNNGVSTSSTIWNASATPNHFVTFDANAVELGVRFRADATGTITGVRFFKGATNTGTHIANLWSNTGTRLATATFSGETASGWQQVAFTSPVAVTANTTYIASYHTVTGQYGVDVAYFATTGVDNAPLHAPQDLAGSANSVFAYGTASAFPTGTYQSSNYWVDVVFAASGGADTTAPAVAITAPSGGASVSGNAVTVSATASDNVGIVGVQFKLDGANLGAEDPATAYSLAWNTTTATNGSHTLTAVARDAAGNTTTSTPVSVTVSNTAPDTTPPTVSMTAPANGATVSGSAVTVSATAADNVGVVGVQFKLDGVNLGAEDTSTLYTTVWNSTTATNGSHTLTATARDAAGNAATATTVTVTVNNAAGAIWIPAISTAWQWQLTGTIDQSVDVPMYDTDLFDTSASVVASLHAKGRKVVCYISAGTYENWRPDASQFPPSVLGGSNGWPGEKWLDIRRIDLLGPIMEARMDLCRQKGFDALEPDNIDGYSNTTGFPLTAQDQLNYNIWLTNAAHARGMSIGLKNDLDQVQELLGYFDWALNEQCFEYSECNLLKPFTSAGKAVFVVEYNLGTSAFCPNAVALSFNAMKKNLNLDASRTACPSP